MKNPSKTKGTDSRNKMIEAAIIRVRFDRMTPITPEKDANKIPPWIKTKVRMTWGTVKEEPPALVQGPAAEAITVPPLAIPHEKQGLKNRGNQLANEIVAKAPTGRMARKWSRTNNFCDRLRISMTIWMTNNILTLDCMKGIGFEKIGGDSPKRIRIFSKAEESMRDVLRTVGVAPPGEGELVTLNTRAAKIVSEHNLGII